MQTIADVLDGADGPPRERLAARRAFLKQRDRIWEAIREGKFYCCPKCTSKLHGCVSANVFRYVDNAKWKAEIEAAS